MRLRPLVYLVALSPGLASVLIIHTYQHVSACSALTSGSSLVPWLFVPLVNFLDELTVYEHWTTLEQSVPPIQQNYG